MHAAAIIPNLIEKHHQRLADAWLAIQKRDGVVGGQITDGQLAEQSRRFLVEFRKGVVMGLFDDRHLRAGVGLDP